ncbi:hypothetical protein Barb4_00747 [Bacteroidales bacterium Barb4]|nr:hypothetical protein Barb4_00747 [Bacteroidales bacterium Barb4]
MKKKGLVLLALITFILSDIKAQNVEWEIVNAGFVFGISEKAGKVQDEPVMMFGTEFRTNLSEGKVSTGIQFNLSDWNRINRHPYAGYAYNLHQQAVMLMLVTDYNFTEIHPKVVPFAGAGVGLSVIEYKESGFVRQNHTASHLIASPRIGVEFFNKVRLTGEYRYQGNHNNFFAVKIGYVIDGKSCGVIAHQVFSLIKK